MAHAAPHPALRGHVLRYCGYAEDTARPLRRREVASSDVTLIFSFGPPLESTARASARSSPASTTPTPTRSTPATSAASRSSSRRWPCARCSASRPPSSPAASSTSTPCSAGPARSCASGSPRRPAGRRGSRCSTARWPAGSRPTPAAGRHGARLEPPARGGRRDPGRRARGELGWSRRHFGARFLEHVGLAPKAAARLLRFRRAVALLERDDGARLAEIAQACGYYDQAHLNRDFRAYAGRSPGEHLGRRLPDGGGVLAA